MRIVLKASTKQIDNLYNTVNGARKGSKSVTVDKDALFNVLQDYSELYGITAQEKIHDLIEENA